MQEDFNYWVDSLMVEAAERQSSAKIEWLDFVELAQSVSENFPPTWIAAAADRARDAGWGRFSVDGSRGRRIFKINGSGISHAAEVRQRRHVPTLKERARAIPYGKGAWEVIKLMLAALFGWFLKTYIG